MDYLNRVLGIRVYYQDENLESMPNYILSRYRIQRVTLDGIKAIFVHPEQDLDPINAVKKHMDRIEKVKGVPAVLVPDHLTYREKEYLLRDHIPFIVDGKQIYLPFMAVYLQERGDGEKQDSNVILPSAQTLFLFFIAQGCEELLTSEAARELGLTATSISRASRQLEDMGLIKAQKRGVQKIIYSDKTSEELFELAKDSLCNPVKRVIYVPKTEIREELLLSGYSALSEYSMINPPAVQCFATASISAWERISADRLHNADDQCEVQLWRYDPQKLTKSRCVDRLSLALSLNGENDERVKEAVEKMLADVWRETNGKTCMVRC